MTDISYSPSVPKHMDMLNAIIEDDPICEIQLKYTITNHKDLADTYKYHYARSYRITADQLTITFLVIDEPEQEIIILEYNKNELIRGFLYSEHVKHYYEEHEYQLFTKEQLNTYYLKNAYVSLENFETGNDYDMIESFDFSIVELDEF